MPGRSSLITFAKALDELDDRRIQSVKPLIPPQILIEDLPLTLEAANTVVRGRQGTDDIIKGRDDRLLVVVGPCSVHDVRAVLDYATRLKAYADQAMDDLHICMRVYFEKPRSVTGWKGFINDPNLNGSFQINKGLRLARGLLLEIANMGLPSGCEFLDTISPQYTADLVSWGAIGARTAESQIHRELTSGLPMSIGYKNGTEGSLKIAIDGVRAAAAPHVFLSVTKQGLTAIVETKGNDSCHIILRGSSLGPNYGPQHVEQAVKAMSAAGVQPRVMVDTSHGNSERKHELQMRVVDSVAEQLSMGDENAQGIIGVMIESFLVEGNQPIPPEGACGLTYGQSITDSCVSWENTVVALNKLRAGVRARRKAIVASGRARAASAHAFSNGKANKLHAKDDAASLLKAAAGERASQSDAFNDLPNLGKSLPHVNGSTMLHANGMPHPPNGFANGFTPEYANGY